MRSPWHPYAVLMVFLAACTLALVDPEMRTTLSLEVRTCSSCALLHPTDRGTGFAPGGPSSSETLCSSRYSCFLRLCRTPAYAGSI
ncbi:hypothetical protein BU25DRAFT_405253 [Macroventuria anomochaeta]|uniref:Uncharacterized protein n=1 Tax=Macroventuria anomochaeta TaxID=301207 RepID=A0ACB6SH40_9PLEO|nr:uncharacterized protein BU25DRAFT_405253 [Macroventuria anomochaeta]KAF2633349.1 hypothetical protein BU25DRAFT_405253 [Macroventuria anomochaeta]